jgi:peroxiredoxin
MWMLWGCSEVGHRFRVSPKKYFSDDVISIPTSNREYQRTFCVDSFMKFFDEVKTYQFFIHAVLIVLSIQVVVLSKQNRQLKLPREYEAVDSLKEGDLFSVDTVGGLQEAGPFDVRDMMIVFVFTTNCHYCHESLSFWNRVADVVYDHGVSVMGISLSPRDATLQYMKSNEIDYRVYLARDADTFQKENHFRGIPQTILTSKEGRVMKVWQGLFSSGRVEEVVELVLRQQALKEKEETHTDEI